MKRFLSILMIGIFGIFLVAGSASALSLRLTQGSNSTNIADGGAGDVNPTTGAVTFIGQVGVYTLNVSTGLSKPVVGNLPFSIEMDLNSISTSSSAGSLLLELSDDNFTLNPTQSGNYNFIASIGGTTQGTIDFYNTYIDYDNVLFGQDNMVTSIGSLSGPAFAASAFGSVAADPDLFSFTQAVQITHSGSGTSSFDATVSVPDASIMWLLGTAFIALGFLGRRKSQEQL